MAVPFEEEDPKTADLLVKFFKKSLHYLEMNLIGSILIPGVGGRGDIFNKPGSLEKGYELGRKLAKRRLKR